MNKLDCCNVFSKNNKNGFTIVELLVVIVVIGILASITIVSYTGITQKAIVSSLQSDLVNATKQIQIFQALDSNNNYPTANNCPTPGVTEICLKTSTSNTFGTTYAANNNASPKLFSLNATNNTTTYRTSNNSIPASYTSLAVTDPANWMQVGTQVWAKYNLNVGTRINGATTQTNNAILEKYCYSDSEANCTANGGLYQWDEAMQYVITAGAQGICPIDSHIPTDNEIKTLETYLGMTQAQADNSSWRGTDQGTKMKLGGVSGLDIPLSGYRSSGGVFGDTSAISYLWSSAESSASFTWVRLLYTDHNDSLRSTYSKANGFSVRCIMN